MVVSEACRMLSRDAILAINKRFRCAVLLDASVRDVISSLRSDGEAAVEESTSAVTSWPANA